MVATSLHRREILPSLSVAILDPMCNTTPPPHTFGSELHFTPVDDDDDSSLHKLAEHSCISKLISHILHFCVCIYCMSIFVFLYLCIQSKYILCLLSMTVVM